ncbi:DinB family protein [Neobacillus niacini]|uniref:DinB family protein n=1 Tax=Neobacillus niacini TaxID=86668 RepID=UPI0021CB7D28|nr:DinB family protein [Neobacillus niacini]MCM3764734.1 DinB family protein [Neobacillus niacini]
MIYYIRNKIVKCSVSNATSVPSSAEEIADSFRKVSADTIDALKQQWTDASLSEMKNVFGMDMPGGIMLLMLNKHIIHHRGQISVLFRQAGLRVPGIYGPTRQDWSQMGMDAPTI